MKKTSYLYNLAPFIWVPLISSYDEFKAAAIGQYETGIYFHYPVIFIPIKQYAIIHHIGIFDRFFDIEEIAVHFDMKPDSYSLS